MNWRLMEMAAWETAARNLKKRYPQYVVLAPELIQHLILRQTRTQELARYRSVAPSMYPGTRVAVHVGAQQFVPTPSQPSNDTGKGDSKPPYWIIYVCLAVVGAVLKGITGSSSHKTATPEIQIPQYKSIDFDEMNRRSKAIDDLQKVLNERNNNKWKQPGKDDPNRLWEDMPKKKQPEKNAPGDVGREPLDDRLERDPLPGRGRNDDPPTPAPDPVDKNRRAIPPGNPPQ